MILNEEKDEEESVMKKLISLMKQDNPDIEKSIFRSVHNLHLDTMAGFKTEGQWHSFLERYESLAPEE